MNIKTYVRWEKNDSQKLRFAVGDDDQSFGSVGVRFTPGSEDMEMDVSVGLGDGLSYSPTDGVSLTLGGEYQGVTIYQDARVSYAFDGSGEVDPSGSRNSTEIEVTDQGLEIRPYSRYDRVNATADADGFSIDPVGPNNRLEVRQENGRLVFDPFGDHNNIVITGGENSVTIDPERTGNSTLITREGNTITIDPFGPANSTTIVREGQTITINPPSFRDHSTITSDETGYSVDIPGWNNSTRVEAESGSISVGCLSAAQSMARRCGALSATR